MTKPEGLEMLSKPQRTGSMVRMLVLLVLLLLVGAAFAYDRLVAMPEFSKAWEKIKEIDGGERAGRTRNEDIHKLIKKKPAQVDSSRQGFIVETYSWQRGLPLSTYEIHIVYAQNDANDSLFYFSACANQLPGIDNFPRKEMIVVNLNPPLIGRTGGPPQDRASQPTHRVRNADPGEGESNKRKRPEPEDEETDDDPSRDDSDSKDKNKDKDNGS